MSDWYYATADGQRHGPLPAADLHALAAAGTIGAQTLVWREGLAQWRPLHEFAAELELPTLPPPLPAPATQPPPSGLSGCAIAALVVVVGLVVVAMLGILAAIALPAYHDYTLRAHASAAIVEARALQAQVAESLAANGRCPRNGEEDFGEPASYAGGHLASATFGEFEESGLCGLEARIAAPGKAALDGKAIWLEYRPDGRRWQCSSDVDDRYLPASCRG
jgi:type IV pilus assembly protein PilA